MLRISLKEIYMEQHFDKQPSEIFSTLKYNYLQILNSVSVFLCYYSDIDPRIIITIYTNFILFIILFYFSSYLIFLIPLIYL